MLIILILAGLACLMLLTAKDKERPQRTNMPAQPARTPLPFPEDDTPPDSEYARTVQRTRRIARKTYVFGRLRGKYRGALTAAGQRSHDDPFMYELEIYEASLELEPAAGCCCTTPFKTVCHGLHTETEGRFEEQHENAFPRERLPLPVRALLLQEGAAYEVTIYEPALSRVELAPKLHQTDDRAVFGTIDACISGTLLDFTAGEYTERLIMKHTGRGALAPLPDLRPALPLIRLPSP